MHSGLDWTVSVAVMVASFKLIKSAGQIRAGFHIKSPRWVAEGLLWVTEACNQVLATQQIKRHEALVGEREAGLACVSE